jgi:hypothetical protein
LLPAVRFSERDDGLALEQAAVFAVLAIAIISRLVAELPLVLLLLPWLLTPGTFA